MFSQTTVLFKNLWPLITPYWKSSEKWLAWLLLAVIIGLSLGAVYIEILINQWFNDFYNALQNLDKAAFIKTITRFSYLAVIYIIFGVYRIYLNQLLSIRWRRWLTTAYLDRWLAKQTHYHMQLVGHPTDNPDQRISEDIGQFVDLTLGLSLGLLREIVTLCSFVTILWLLSGPLNFKLGGMAIYIPGYMVWAALAYAIAGTWLTMHIGRPLVALNFTQQRFEANFRFNLVHFRENSENISFYRGESQEKQGLIGKFSAIYNNYLQIMQRQKRLGWFTSFYGQAAIIFPFLVAAPRVFAKEIQLGGVLQISNAFAQVQGALSYIVNSYVDIATWRATSNRLISFHRAMEQVEQQLGFTPQYSSHPLLEVANLTLKLPNGQILLKELNLQLKSGDSLLISGPSGCGKTTLLRTLAGIWPFAEGRLSIPQQARLMFLPQHSYLPLGTLKEALCYPHSKEVTQAQAQQMLQLCQLGHLHAKMNQNTDWAHTLSVGEQQRIGFARVLLAKPDFVFLDEATSALDEASESYFYQLLKTQCPTTCIVSIGHRASLKLWHSQEPVFSWTKLSTPTA